MSMPIGPIWSVLHLGIKFPAAAAIVVAGYAYYASDDVETNPTLNQSQSMVTNGPMLALTFDDGWRSVRDVALPIMSQRGMIGTNYITTNFVDSDHEKYISQEHVLEFVAAGWEIGAHTLNHDDLTTLTEPEIINNLFEPQMVLSEWINHPVTTFSSPYGAFNDTVLEHAAVAYLTHVNAWSDANGLNTPDTFDANNINRIDTENITIPDLCDTISGLSDDDFYVIIFHKITDIPGQYSMSPRDFNTVLDCVEESGVQLVTVSQGARAMQERAQ